MTLSQFLNALFGGGGMLAVGWGIYKGITLLRQGARGKILTEAEARRKYVAEVYADRDWEAAQHHYWREAYFTAVDVIRENQGMAHVPPRQPYPRRQEVDDDDA